MCKLFAQTMDERENAMADQTLTTDGICANSGSKESEINVSKSRIRSQAQELNSSTNSDLPKIDKSNSSTNSDYPKNRQIKFINKSDLPKSRGKSRMIDVYFSIIHQEN